MQKLRVRPNALQYGKDGLCLRPNGNKPLMPNDPDFATVGRQGRKIEPGDRIAQIAFGDVRQQRDGLSGQTDGVSILTGCCPNQPHSGVRNA